MDADEIKRRCEEAFQAGGPRVYTVKGWTVRPCALSAKRAAELAFHGESVYARQKNRSTGRYEWVNIETALERLEAARVTLEASKVAPDQVQGMDSTMGGL